MQLQFTRHLISNGLKLIIHQDTTTPLVVMNILYDVGSKDESPDKTGFAHLFEHLMFGGSKNIPNYDTPLQNAGGENNAFTNQDFTNYYLTLPKNNIETGFWLESDRMLELRLSKKSLDVQRKVVIEEFNQRYLNQPYGKVPLLLQPLAYKVHPYQWATIGKDISHIANATLDDVQNFYNKFYNPGNAILVVTGDVEEKEIIDLTEKWFGSIQKIHTHKRKIPSEIKQKEPRRFQTEEDVPMHQIIISFPMCKRTDSEYYTFDILTDILAEGDSSRFSQSLVKKQRLFASVNAYISGTIDEGQVIISGYLLPDITLEKAEKMIWKELQNFIKDGITDEEMKKVKNKTESRLAFENIGLLDRAMNLAYFELLGSVEMIYEEPKKYSNVGKEDILRCASELFKEEKSSTLVIVSKNIANK